MAGRKIGDVFLRVNPDTEGFERRAEPDIRRSGGAVGGTFSKAFAGALGGVTAALGGIFAAQKILGFASDALGEAREAAKIARLTEAAIRSTGGAARVTAQQVEGLADELSTLVGIDDDLIQASENLLLTFTNIRNNVGKGNDIFNQAEKAIVDMTAAMNNGEITQDGLKTSTIQLGKALNDPIKGLTALSKVGVTFTQAQKDQIKSMVASGNIMGAQKVILAELAKEFGGAAAAAADPADKAAAAWGNVKEVLGNLLLPTVNKLMDLFTSKVVPFFQVSVLPVITRLADGFQKHVVPAIRVAAQWIGEHIMPRLREFGAWIQEKVVPVVVILAKALRDDMKKGFDFVKQAIADNRPQLEQFANGLKMAVQFIVEKVVPVVGPMLQNGFKTLGFVISVVIKAISLFVDALNFLKSVGDKVGTFFSVTVPAYFRAGVNGIETAWNRVKEAAKAPVQFVIETVINKGIIGAFNWVASKVGASGIPLVPMPFDRGGVLPGYRPGRDTIPAMLSEGEGVAVPQLVRQIGAKRFMDWNRAARSGQRIEGFADGGIAGLISDPVGWVRDRVAGPIGSIRSAFGNSRLVDLLSGMANTAKDRVTTKIRALVNQMFGMGVSSLGQMRGTGGWQWQMAVLRQVFPGLPLRSGFRPGARVASGELSYHALGRAVDLPPLVQVFNWIKARYGASTRELIFSPMGGRQVWNGREHLFTGSVVPQHYNHIHWAYKLGGIVGRRGIPSLDAGGFLSPGLNLVHNGTGRPEPVGAGGLEQVVSLLQRLIKAVEAVAPGVGQEINGGARLARQLGRAY